MPDKVELFINNKIVEGWESIDASKSIEAIAGRFTLSVSNTVPDFIAPGLECQLKLNEQLVVDGYIDSIEANLDSQNNSSFSLKGRDKAGDLVDCSAIKESGGWQNPTLQRIIEDVCQPFEIQSRFENEDDKKFNLGEFRLRQETAFEVIERACRLRGVFPLPDKGRVLIGEIGKIKTSSALVLGQNILSADLVKSHNERFRNYFVKGQSATDDEFNGEDASSVSANSKDKQINRYRPLIVIAEDNVDPQTAKDRAEWEAAVRFGRSLDLNVKVQGWSEYENGPLWDINKIVSVNIDKFGVNDNYLIRSVSYSLSDKGSTTSLSLTHEEAYLKKPEIEE